MCVYNIHPKNESKSLCPPTLSLKPATLAGQAGAVSPPPGSSEPLTGPASHEKQSENTHLGFGPAGQLLWGVLEKVGAKAKQPDSAMHCPSSYGCSTFSETNDEVLVEFCLKGHAVGDLTGICLQVIKVARVSLLSL